MHKVGGDLPVECIEFMYSSFLSEAFSASFQVPSYSAYLARTDLRPGAFATKPEAPIERIYADFDVPDEV